MFDTLDHSILIQKLKRYGIHGVVKDWFEDYLKDRSLVTKITTSPNEVTISDTFNITCGAMQGSFLGPLLFIIFVTSMYSLCTVRLSSSQTIQPSLTATNPIDTTVYDGTQFAFNAVIV